MQNARRQCRGRVTTLTSAKALIPIFSPYPVNCDRPWIKIGKHTHAHTHTGSRPRGKTRSHSRDIKGETHADKELRGTPRSRPDSRSRTCLSSFHGLRFPPFFFPFSRLCYPLRVTFSLLSPGFARTNGHFIRGGI